MKIDNAEVKSEFRIWCEHCSIRIAPHEEKVADGGKTYHQRCYSKHVSKGKTVSTQSGDLLRGGK